MKERIINLLTYSSEDPLLFTSLYFWVFFGLVILGYSLVYRKMAARNAYLFLVSLFFYYKTGGFYFFILLISTVADYAIGQQIHRSIKPINKKLWLAMSIVINLLILVYFKYAYFFADFFTQITGVEVTVSNYFSWATNELLGTDFVWDKILLPVGISFFTFQTMSYAIDIYRGQVKPVKNIFDFGFYVSFFPQLVAGPIVRASDFIPQLYQPYALTKRAFGIGFFWIINGLLKKLFLADYIAVNFVDRIFSNPSGFSGFENMMALFGYSLQVYADFSGYTDIAIGTALWLGFRLPKNFNSPYKASSVAEFWKRWHISLSTWLKDYLYIPMGGNRSGSLFSNIMIGVILLFLSLLAADFWIIAFFISLIGASYVVSKVSITFRDWLSTNVNLMLTMLIGGLWHGASWNFVVWGGLNGLGLVVYKLWRKVSPWEDSAAWYVRPLRVVITLVFITFTRIWFRSESWESASIMLRRIVYHFEPQVVLDVLTGSQAVMLIMLAGYTIHWLPTTFKNWYQEKIANAHILLKGVIALVTILLVYQVLSADLQPFIYFAF